MVTSASDVKVEARMKLAYAFEEIGQALEFVPHSARRALDLAGRKLSLEGWRSLGAEDRRALCVAGVSETVDVARVAEAAGRAVPAPEPIEPPAPPDARAVPAEIHAALGTLRQIDDAQWAALRSVDRHTLWKLRARPERLLRAHDEILGAPVVLAHIGDSGEARMVDVGPKPATARRAIAAARVRMAPEVLARILEGDLPKGDVFAAARIAGIQAAKRTPDLIPLCHTVALTRVEVAFDADRGAGTVAVRATAEAVDRTGVEMEALVAASVASLTIYDMVKSADRWMTIDGVMLLEKSGGKSGELHRPTAR
jgi:cyclic pyranopterin phosphate synthase